VFRPLTVVCRVLHTPVNAGLRPAVSSGPIRARIPQSGDWNVYAIRSKGGIVYVQEWLFEASKVAPWGLSASIGLLAIGIGLYRKDRHCPSEWLGFSLTPR
jgi:hypothetical protein